LALSVPLSRFTPRIGGGSAFYVRHRSRVRICEQHCQHIDMNINTITIQLAAILAASLLIGCSHHSASPPTGSWSADSGETLALQKDGTFTLKNLPPNKKTGAQLVSDLSGTYTMVDSTHIKLDVVTPRGTYSTVYLFSVTGGDLSFQQAGSSEVKTYHHAIN
jgi:hypothetical protein